MGQPAIQTSFASGEWAPKLRSRVDIAKYKSGAALLRNFYIDYSGGGASTRQGTKFINQCKATGARLIPFQPSTTLSYVLEFGQNYIRFYSNGAPIVEAGTVITGVTQANPGVVTDVAHGYATGDWVFITGVVGMTQLNGNYYIVVKTGANTYTLTDLNGNAINTTGFGAYISGGTAQRVYTIASPYATADLFSNPLTGNPGIKFVQDVTSMIICHPNYPAGILTIVSATNWTFSSINFGSTITTPANVAAVPTGSGNGFYYAYTVTAVDVNGQESIPATPVAVSNTGDMRAGAVTNTISWNATPGAVSYNVYKASEVSALPVVNGAPYGFIGNCTGLSFTDSPPGIDPDFSQTPPIAENPFLGAPVKQVNLTAGGSYSNVTAPSAVIDAPSSGTQATTYLTFKLLSSTLNAGGTGYQVGDNVNLQGNINIQVTSTNVVTNAVTGYNVLSATPFQTVGTLPGTIGQIEPNPGTNGTGLVLNSTWQVAAVTIIQNGSGYVTVPNVTFSSGAATAVAVLGTSSFGNPSVPGFIQERLMLANQPQAIQSYNISQPGSFFNFNVSNPSEDDDAISGTIIAEELNDIRNLTPVPTGMIAFTGKGAWLINGGGGISTQTPITPSNQTAQPQGFNGANDMKPIKINMDALYVTNKGNYVRDLTYNLYAQIFTGSDISAISNHLFFNYYMLDWAWSEEPFKTCWAIRSDGQMLSLGFVKEQELIAWAHHDTNGQFKSVCSVIENVNGNIVDAVYLIVERTVNGNVVQYVERMADRYFTYGYEDAWSVDCALQTTPAASPSGTLVIAGNASAVGNIVTLTDTTDAPFTAPMAAGNWIVRAGGGIYKITAFTSTSIVTATILRVPTLLNPYTNLAYNVVNGWTLWTPTATVTGLTQLISQSVVGVADGVPVGPFVVSATGSVALGLTATKITLGLAYLPQLQTLPLDLGEPTVQGERKKITGVTVRVADTLGISIGRTFAGAVPMKDFTLGNVPTTSTGPAAVTGLVNGDGRTIIDTAWDEAGNYCIQQNLPYPATILGAFPEISLGDTK